MLFRVNMNIFSTLMFLIGLMATALSSSICGPKCSRTNRYHHPDLKHVSELGSNSVAPWEYLHDTKAGREPAVIQYAHCKGCTVQNMTAKPIIIQVSVYERVRNGTDQVWCKCPFKLAVGCACVNKQ